MNLLILWVFLSVAAFIIICGLSSSPHESNRTIIFANRKNQTKDRFYKDYFYINIKGDFRCYGKPYVGNMDFMNNVHFYEDDGHEWYEGPDSMDFVTLKNGTFNVLLYDFDDIFHPYLEVFARLFFNCSCLGVYESLTSPRTRQHRNATIAEEHPYYLGIIELTHVCKYPDLYRRHATLNYTEFPNIDDPYASHFNFSKFRK